jgi:CRP-like cAMP-binding protein
MKCAMNHIIRAVKLFQTLSDADCCELMRFMRIRQYESGVTVFERGKPGDSMLVLMDGALAVMLPAPRRGNIEVARVSSGEVIGEMACIDPCPRNATLVAVHRTVAYELSRRDLTRMREVAPELAHSLVTAIIRSVAQRLQRIDDRIERELAGHLAARLPELRKGGAAPEGQGAWDHLLGRLRGNA